MRIEWSAVARNVRHGRDVCMGKEGDDGAKEKNRINCLNNESEILPDSILCFNIGKQL